MNRKTTSSSQLIADLRQLGVQPDHLLLVHTSLRNVGWVSDGPAVVVDALRTVLCPAGTRGEQRVSIIAEPIPDGKLSVGHQESN